MLINNSQCCQPSLDLVENAGRYYYLPQNRHHLPREGGCGCLEYEYIIADYFAGNDRGSSGGRPVRRRATAVRTSHLTATTKRPSKRLSDKQL